MEPVFIQTSRWKAIKLKKVSLMPKLDTLKVLPIKKKKNSHIYGFLQVQLNSELLHLNLLQPGMNKKRLLHSAMDSKFMNINSIL